MINFPMFIEGLLMPSLGLGIFFVYKRLKEKKRKEKKVSFIAHPSTT